MKENNVSYVLEQRRKRYKHNKDISLALICLVVLRLTVLQFQSDYTDEVKKELTNALTITITFSIIFFFIARYYVNSPNAQHLALYKYLDLFMSIIQVVILMNNCMQIRKVEDDYLRGMLMSLPILVLFSLETFLFRDVIFAAAIQLLYLFLFFLFLNNKTPEYMLSSIISTLIISCFSVLGTYLFLKESKENYELRAKLLKKDLLYNQFMNSMKDSVVIYSMNDSIIFQNLASKSWINNCNWLNLCTTIKEASDHKRTLYFYLSSMLGDKQIPSDRKNYFDGEFELHSNSDYKLFEITVIGGELFEDKGTIAVIIKNITKKRKDDEERIAEKYKHTIFNSLSHEIRTPLNGIVGILQIIKGKINDEELIEHLNIAESNSFFLQNQLNDILDYSQLLTKEFNTHIKLFSINEMFGQLYKVIQPLISRKPIQIMQEIDNIPDFIFSDETRIIQILSNFLSNALKYTARGYIKFIGKYKSSTKTFLLGIKDTGRGMTESQVNSLFQLGSSKEKIYGSKQLSGMGLTISEMMAKTAFNSKIRVKSTVNKGSTFCFMVKDRALPNVPPIEDRRNENIEETKEENVEGSPSSTSTSAIIPSFSQNIGISYGSKLILIVDDGSTNRFVLRGMLSDFKLFIFMEDAEDGQEAVQHVDNALKRGVKDILIFMDLDMPHMDGIEATREIKSMPGSEGIVIIMVTAFASESHRNQSFLAGATDFYNKPASKEIVKKSVYTYLLNK